jgi:ERCC4-type nuclease
MLQEIIIDVNEKPRELIIAALARVGFNIKVEQIRFGDFEGTERVADIIGYPRGLWGVERKTVDDFAKSCFNKRIFTQMDKMANAFTYPYILIEGDLQNKYDEFREAGKPNTDNFLRSTIIKANMKGIYCWVEPTTFDLAKAVWFINKYTKLGDPREYVTRKVGFDHAQVATLCTIPGVGPKTARKILAMCNGQLVKVARASTTYLEAIEDVGPAIADSIYTHFHGKVDLSIKQEGDVNDRQV